jgi:prevent-host-death family protein
MKSTYPVMTVTQAQSNFPRLCRQSKRVLITKRDRPVSVLLPIEDYEAMLETMDLLSDPKAMKVLRAAKAGKLSYKKLNLAHEDFGL